MLSKLAKNLNSFIMGILKILNLIQHIYIIFLKNLIII